jgi:alpha/beta superfamily hydrolase
MIPEQRVSIGVRPGLELEGALTVPAGARAGAVVCHPHPLYGGDMDSAVVVTVARACAHGSLATLRFNFRGAGASGGAWDDGRGEQDDVRAALAHLRRTLGGDAAIALAGYSFGAAMAVAVAEAGEPLAGLALVGPPLARSPWRPAGLPGVSGPVLVVAGADDAYCPGEALEALRRALPDADVVVVGGADHFFSTGLDLLAGTVAAWAAAIS